MAYSLIKGCMNIGNCMVRNLMNPGGVGIIYKQIEVSYWTTNVLKSCHQKEIVGG